MAQAKENMKEGKLTQAARLAEQRRHEAENDGPQSGGSRQGNGRCPVTQAQPESGKDCSGTCPGKKGNVPGGAATQARRAQVSPALDAKSCQSCSKPPRISANKSRRVGAANKFSTQGKTGLAVTSIAPSPKNHGNGWSGELPGELRTRLLQENGRYGDDYARIIQRYFEQVADTEQKK